MNLTAYFCGDGKKRDSKVREFCVCEVKQVQLLGVLKRGLKTECPRQFKLKTPTNGEKKRLRAYLINT